MMRANTVDMINGQDESAPRSGAGLGGGWIASGEAGSVWGADDGGKDARLSEMTSPSKLLRTESCAHSILAVATTV